MLAALEATALAAHLRASAWTYPLVNAGHILGLALLVGAVVPMDVRLMRGRDAAAAVALLRPWAIAGLLLAAGSGFCLFIVQASDYAGNLWFLAKLALIGAALANAALHLAIDRLAPAAQRRTAGLSLAFWIAALVCGRMVAYS